MAQQILRAYKQQYLRVNGESVNIKRLPNGFRVVVDGQTCEFTPKTLVEATKVLAGRHPRNKMNI